jgi:Tfp pilus assembly protein PilF
VEGGADLAPDAAVVLECGPEERGRIAVDRKGTFALELSVPEANSEPAGPNQVSLPQKPAIARGLAGNCELHGEAAGYRSEPVRLAGEPLEGIVQVGTIVLRPLNGTAKTGSFAVSTQSLAAPDGAKRAFAEGQQQARKGKWATACDYFRKAVQAYPRFSLAWLELGRAQVRRKNFTEAQHSFQQATAQDSNLAEAYVELARLALQQNQWNALADATDRLVALLPGTSAMYWFLNSAAKFNLGDTARAENSATRGLRLDRSHQVPQLEYLYGMILVRQHNYQSAAEHIRNYLEIAPHAPDAEQAQRKLTDLERLLSQSPKPASQ